MKNSELLNQNFTIPQDELSKFRGTPIKLKIPKGQILYRFITPSQNSRYGAYWFDYQTFTRIKKFAHENNCKIDDVGRSWLAIKFEFNKEMKYLLKGELISSCFGWKGKTKTQLKDRIIKKQNGQEEWVDEKNVILMGNFNQVFLPNLTENHIRFLLCKYV